MWREMRARKKNVIALLLLGCVSLSAYWYFSRPSDSNSLGSNSKAPLPVPVIVAQAKQGQLPLVLSAVGRTEAYDTVSLKSRIDGLVTSTAYVEGQKVKQGDPLIRLDPADFQAKRLQAEAVLAKDLALSAKAKGDLERYQTLKEKGFISDEKLNEVRTALAAALATVKADQAAVELARLQLSYTQIKAPFNGVVGARLVFPGSSVKTNDTLLAVVNRVDPLYVSFSIPEKHLAMVRESLSHGPLTVEVSTSEANKRVLYGKIAFVDNAVDATTGTFLMKAVLSNQKGDLLPGQFLNVKMVLSELKGVVVIPSEAIQQGADGLFVYVAKPDATAELRKIEVLASYQGMAALAKGVAAGETVVLDGQLRLAPGTALKARLSDVAASQEAVDSTKTATPK